MFFLLLFSGDGDSGAVEKVDVEVTEDTVAADKVDPTLKQVHQCSVHDVESGSVYIRKSGSYNIQDNIHELFTINTLYT